MTGCRWTSVNVCGGEVRPLAECSFSDQSWAILVIAKFELSFEISCNDGARLVYDEDCASKLGNDTAYFKVHFASSEQSAAVLLYTILPHDQGKLRKCH